MPANPIRVRLRADGSRHPRAVSLFAAALITVAAAVVSALAAPPGAAELPSTEMLSRMWAVPGLPDVDRIAWLDLPTYRAQHAVISRGVPGESGHHHHPSITYFDGRYFAGWNDSRMLENRPGQRVRYATSKDGLTWSEPLDLTGRNERRAYTNCGFWLRDRELFALAALRDARDIKPSGEDPLLLAFRWDSRKGQFRKPVTLAKNYFAQNVPRRAPDGDWLILGKSGKDSWSTMKSAKGGVRSLDDWTIRDLPSGGPVEEAEWYTLPNGHLVAHFRTRPTHRLMRSYSVDHGVTWTAPIVTDFPEAGARHEGLRLRNGLYALLVNPNTSGQRLPFSIALSRDGILYDRIANVRADVSKTWGTNETPGYNYMRGLERDGKLFTVYSINQQDIGISIVPMSEIEAQYAEKRTSVPVPPPPERLARVLTVPGLPDVKAQPTR